MTKKSLRPIGKLADAAKRDSSTSSRPSKEKGDKMTRTYLKIERGSPLWMLVDSERENE
jgi:hypothetical protein